MSYNRHVVNIIKRDSSGLPILDARKLKQLLVETQAANIPVAFYSICGSARLGKSFLWNQFVRYLKNRHTFLCNLESKEFLDKFFEWKGGDERHTDGILVYKDPFIFRTSNYRKVALFLMDTQGMFDSTESGKNSGMIFTLSFLISSLQVFNVNKQLEATHLQYSYKVMRIWESVRKSKPGTKPFQTLMFLIRDWRRKKCHALGLQGGNEYVNGFMKTKTSQASDQKDVRQEIRNNFESVCGFLLPEPGDKIVDMDAEKNDCQIKDVKVEFYKYAQNLFQHLCKEENIVVKTVDEKVLSGKDLYTYIVHCAELVAKFPGVLEPFGTFVEHDYRAEMRTITCNAVTSYISNVRNTFQNPRNRSELHQQHLVFKNKAIEEFQRNLKSGGRELHDRWENILKNLIEKNYNKFKDCVRSESAFVNSLQDYEAVLRSDPKDFDDRMNRIFHPKDAAKERSDQGLRKARKRINGEVYDDFIARQCCDQMEKRANILLEQHLLRINRRIAGIAIGVGAIALGGVLGLAAAAFEVPVLMTVAGVTEVTAGLLINTAIAGGTIGLITGLGTYALMNYLTPVEQVIRMAWAEGGDDLSCIKAEVSVPLSYGVVRFKMITEPN